MRILELGFAVATAIACASIFNTRNMRTENDTNGTENTFGIIPGISCGMKIEEVFDVVGTDNYKNAQIDDSGEMEYYYQLDSVDVFDINMPAEMFFEFSPTGVLFNYGYHIGCIHDVNTDEYSYPYDEQQLMSAYGNIYDALELNLGPGEKTSVASEAIEEYSWKFKNNEEIWFIVGTDLWSSGVNEILISSADDSLRN